MTSAGYPVGELAGEGRLSWWHQLGAMWRLAQARTAAMYAYRATMFLFMATTVMQLFILKRVWASLYRANSGALSIPFENLAVYLTIVNLIIWSFPTFTVTEYLRERIREGSIVFDMVRPLSFIPQMVSQLVGALVGSLLVVAFSLPAVALAGSLTLPVDKVAAGAFVVSLFLGYTIAGLLIMILSLVMFWTIEVHGITMLYVLVSSFLSGAMVPISVFPDRLRTLVEWLPFQSSAYVPASIYVGSMSGGVARRAILIQMMWVGVLSLVAFLVWRRAKHRVVVQGG